jgi:hypothetical protein
MTDSQMDTYTVSDVLHATGVNGADINNWSRRAGGLVLELANAGRGLGRRYSRANVYELALMKDLIDAGMSIAEARVTLRDRFEYILQTRAAELDRPVPDLQALAEQPSVWMGLELTHRDRMNPVCLVICRDERGGVRDAYHCKEAAVSDLLVSERLTSGCTKFTVINVTETLARVDAALVGEELPSLDVGSAGWVWAGDAQ